MATVHLGKLLQHREALRGWGVGRRGVGAGRPVGLERSNPNLRSSVLKLGWGAFGNGQGGVVATDIMKGKVSRSL